MWILIDNTRRQIWAHLDSLKSCADELAWVYWNVWSLGDPERFACVQITSL